MPAGARAPAARPLVVKVDDADAAESPRHPENVPRLHLQHVRRQVPLFSAGLGWTGRAAWRAGRAATFEPATSTHRSSGYSKIVCCTGVCGLAGCRAANLATGGRGARGWRGLPRAPISQRTTDGPHPRPPPSTRRARLATTRKPTPPQPARPPARSPAPPTRTPSVEQRACRPSRRRRPSA